LFLICGIAVGTTDYSTACGTDGGTFQCAARLMADHSAQQRAAQGTCRGSALGVRTHRSLKAGKGDGN
jgi:hypothetical protein